MKETIYNRIPIASIKLVQKWIHELNLEVILAPPRSTKLGNFKVSTEKKYSISINNNLNPYSSLITLTHEIAHAFVWNRYKHSVLPHGMEWKTTYQKLMSNFLNNQIFPIKLLNLLREHLINPKASTTADIALYKCLLDFDDREIITISDVDKGEIFALKNGKRFVKGEKLRKRFKCQEYISKKIYLVHPLAEVVRM